MMRVTGGPGRLMSFLGSCVLILIGISGMACQKKVPPAADTNAVKPEPNVSKPAAVEPLIDKTVVTVNGQAITESQLSRRVDMAIKQAGPRLANLPPQYAEQVKKQARQQVLENLVIEQLLNEQVVALGVKITDEEILAEIAKNGAKQQPQMSVEQFKAAVEGQGGNFEDVKKDFGRGMGYMKLLETKYGDKATVNDEEAKQYYDSHLTDFAIPEQVRASHILAMTQPKDPNADPNQVKAAAKEKIEKLYKQVKEGGDFAAIAKENSDCPSAAEGGDLGLNPREAWVKPFSDAAFALKVGEVSNIVETQFGYHIIKVTDHKDASTTPFEEAKTRIVDGLSRQKRQTILREYIQSLKDKAKIVYAEGEGPAPQPVAPSQPQASQPTVSPAPATAPATQPAATPAPEPNATKR